MLLRGWPCTYLNVWIHKSSSMENNSCLLACRLYRRSGCVSWSLVILGKRSHETDRVKFWHTYKYGRGVCMSVFNLSERWRLRLSVFTTTDIKRETVRAISTGVCRWDYLEPEPAKCAQEWMCICVCVLTSCSGDSCSMSAWRHLRPGRKWLPITSSEITAQEVKDLNEQLLIQSSTLNTFAPVHTVGLTILSALHFRAHPENQALVSILHCNNVGLI